jgi:glycine cleavage system H protein
METLGTFATNTAVLLGGLLVRFLIFAGLLALISVPILLAVYGWNGIRELVLRRRGEADAGGIRWRPGFAYAPNHAWIGAKRGGAFTVGLDDLAQQLLAGKTSIVLPPAGSRLAKGETMAAIRCGSHCASIPAPFAGTVVRSNSLLAEDPGLLHREPYHHGWLLRVRPDNGALEGTLRGHDAREWLREENDRYRHFLEERLGMAAADGGELTGSPAELLPDPAWREAVGRFLGAR